VQSHIGENRPVAAGERRAALWRLFPALALLALVAVAAWSMASGPAEGSRKQHARGRRQRER
jgi:hypothetical protein